MSDYKNHRPLIVGMPAIAKFFALPRFTAARLAARGDLPGTFKLGGRFFLDEAVANEAIATLARGQKVAA